MLTKPHLAEDNFTLHLLLHLRSHYMEMDNSGPDANRRCDLFATCSAIHRCFSITGGHRLRVAKGCTTIGAEFKVFS